MKTNPALSTDWEQLPVILTVPEAAKLARVGKAQIYNLSHTKHFPAIKIGRTIRIPRDAFRRWLENKEG